jgi:hypothetical protein
MYKTLSTGLLFYICRLRENLSLNTTSFLCAHKFIMEFFLVQPDPYWIRIRSRDPDSESGSGSRRAKITHKKRKK